MNSRISSFLRCIVILGLCAGTVTDAAEIDRSGNAIFDLYFFGNGESGIFGTTTGIEWIDASKSTSGHVKDSSTHYWNDELKQAMVNAVNTWTSAIATPYDHTRHARKLRIGFFLDDASAGGVMSTSMAGYASTQTVTTKFETEYGPGANIYSVAEWAWRDNNITSHYQPDWVMDGANWETNILADEANSIDIAIVLNPLITSFGYDTSENYYRSETTRTAQQMQNIATHEMAHAMGVDSRLYTQRYDSSGNSVAELSGYVSTWDSLITLNGDHIVFTENGEIVATYATLSDLQAAGWECEPGKDPYAAESYTGTEIQYDPERRLSLAGELGVHISAIMLEGDTLEHLSHADGTNVLGPGGTANSAFSAADLRALELLGWSINHNTIPEPASGALFLLSFSGLAMRRRR